MSTIVTSEGDLSCHGKPLPVGIRAIHFKMVGIGVNTLTKADYMGSKICEIARNQPGFFLITDDGTNLREAMHDLVDRFCNAQEEANESKNQESPGP